MKILLIPAATAALILSTLPAAADRGGRFPVADRVEDRIDRRESLIDRQVTTGPLDLVEDRLDRIESRRDRRGLEGPRVIDRHERRSWWRLWGQPAD